MRIYLRNFQEIDFIYGYKVKCLMLKKVAYIAVFLFSMKMATAQGFDWQHSSRMPTGQPDLFLGITFSGGFIDNLADLGLFEEYLCTRLKSGNGTELNAGIISELWFDDGISLSLAAKYSSVLSTMKQQNSYPMVDEYLVTEYVLESSLKLLEFDFRIKKTIAETHLFISAGFNTGILLSNGNDFKEKVVSPANWPLLERNLFNGSISEYSPVSASAVVCVGWDLNLGLDTYTTVSFEAAYDLNSLVKTDDWKRWTFGLKVNLLRGIYTGLFD